jgi:uncharacterized repeat protein (TIGR03806 family)
MHLGRSFALVLSLVALVPGGCSEDTEPPVEPKVVVTPPPVGEPYDRLSDWHLFRDLALQTPADGVVPYDVIAPLFSDYTTKFRFMYVPEGQTVGYEADDILAFPEGSIFVKTFAHAADSREPFEALTIVETRILIREPDGWVAHTYVWNEEQTEAERLVSGTGVPVSFVGPDGQTIDTDYRVPNTNECKNCHKVDDTVVPLGPKVRQLDRNHEYDGVSKNQLKYLVELGWLADTLPPEKDRERLVDPYGDEELFLRVRSYFEANCASCHRNGGEASTSKLLLDFASTNPADNPEILWGICKTPASAGGANCGHTYDVVPGRSDLSIMICRMTSTDPEKRMPPLGSKVVHQEGLALLSEWIDSLPAGACTP